ncbi:MAG TPA: lipopolysaccharide biosynthesis protein [Steroidobacteraceae bacterium]
MTAAGPDPSSRGPPQDPPAASLSGRVARAAVWAIGMRVGERVLGIVSTLILARLLVPADYGLVAMATVVIAFMETLTASGVDTVLISKARVDRADYNTAWTINVMLGAALFVVIVALSWPAAAYFRTPELAPVLALLSLTPLLYGFENIGTIDFRRNLQFNRDVAFVLGKKVISLVTTVPLALLWRNHWALVAGLLSMRLGGVVLSFVMSPYRPRFSLERFREFFHFSKWLALYNFLVFLRLRLTDFLTGRLHGPGALGVFTMANELASMPSTELVMPVNRALFPGYSKMAEDLPRLGWGFVRAVGLVSLLAIPASVGLAVVADDAVPLLLGSSWLATVPVIQLLAIAGVSTALQISCWSVFMATQRFRFLVYLNLFHLAVMVPAMFVFVPPQGAVGAALAHLTACIASLPVGFAMVRMVTGVPIAALAGAVWRPALAAVAMYLVVETVRPGALGADSPPLALLAGLGEAVAVGAAAYAGAIALLWLACGRPQSAEREALDYLRGRLRRLAGRD